jgi:hypothetical protein
MMADSSLFGRRERDVRARAHGRVLDLGECRARGQKLDTLVAAGETFDCAVSIFELCRSPHPLGDARAAAALLVDGGQFIYLEPTAPPGLSASVQRLAGHAAHDIPAILREAGFLMSECDRLYVPGWPARMYAAGVATQGVLHEAGVTS